MLLYKCVGVGVVGIADAAVAYLSGTAVMSTAAAVSADVFITTVFGNCVATSTPGSRHSAG